MIEIVFNSENEKKFHAIVSKYEIKRSALLPVLYLAQDQFGFLSEPVLNYVADRLEIPRAFAYEATSFYTMFKKKDMGAYCLQVCNNVTCCMMGSEKIIDVIKEELGISFFEVTADNRFSLVPVQCLGSCDTAPVLQINQESYHENLTEDGVRNLIKKLKTEVGTT